MAKGLAGGHADRTLFEGLDLTVAPGDVVGVVGANGAGKTTLLRLLAGEDGAPGRDGVTTAPSDAFVGMAAPGARAGARRDRRRVRRPAYRRYGGHPGHGGSRRRPRLRRRGRRRRLRGRPRPLAGQRRPRPRRPDAAGPGRDRARRRPRRPDDLALGRPGRQGRARGARAQPLRRRPARRAHQRPRPGRAGSARAIRPRSARGGGAGLPRPRVPPPLRHPDRRARPGPACGLGPRRRLRVVPGRARGGPPARPRGLRGVRRHPGRPRGPGPHRARVEQQGRAQRDEEEPGQRQDPSRGQHRVGREAGPQGASDGVADRAPRRGRGAPQGVGAPVLHRVGPTIQRGGGDAQRGVGAPR